MSFHRHLKMIRPYLAEAFVRSKAAWGGGAIIIGVGFIEHMAGYSLPRLPYIIAFLSAVIAAQFWHGLIQYEKMRPRFEIRPPKQHFWGDAAHRGSTGTGLYFEVFNPSLSESLECVRVELISIEKQPTSMNGLLPFPLHIRHLNYCIAETFINPGCTRGFDFATGPDHNANPQRVIVIPCIMGGDRGFERNGIPVPYDSYCLRIRVSARHCRSMDISIDICVEDELLRCVKHQISVVEEI
jgi:hypothetical protein